MKTILLLSLALASPLAQALTFQTQNQGGGLIVLTGRPCPNQVTGKGLKEAYATLANGSRLEGCWTYFDGLVQIGWGEGKRSTLDPNIFTQQEDEVPASAARPPKK